jgi:hypothetical protein
MRLCFNTPMNVRPIWGMLEGPILAAALRNFSATFWVIERLMRICPYTNAGSGTHRK